MDLAWIASEGEWYRVQAQEDGWALANWEGDAPELVVWIEITVALALETEPVVAAAGVPAATPGPTAMPTPPVTGETTSSAVQGSGPIAPYMAKSPEYGMDIFVWDQARTMDRDLDKVAGAGFMWQKSLF